MNIGQLFSHYLIEEKIGEGGFGDVFRAQDLNTGMEVAVKCSHPGEIEKINDKEQRFMREVACISKLRHPNIVQLYDYGALPDRTLFLVMEYVSGYNLEDLIKRDAPFSYVYASDVILQVLDALAAAHAQSIIHRDLKPANIMLVKQGLRSDVVKLLDFGIAKAIDGSTPDLTQLTFSKNRGLGTPQYMPPEQFYGKQLGPHSDLYAVGLVFFELITGKQAVSGKSLSEIVEKQLHGTIEIPEPFSLGPLGDVFRRALAKSIDMRYTSAAEMYQDIDAIVRYKSPFLALYSSATAPSKQVTVTFSPTEDQLLPLQNTNNLGEFEQDDEMSTIDNQALEDMLSKDDNGALGDYKTMIFDDGLENLPEIPSAPNTVNFANTASLPMDAPVLPPRPGEGIPNVPRISQAQFGAPPQVPQFSPQRDLPPTEIGDALQEPPGFGGDDDIELMIPTDDASRLDPALIMSSASTCPIPAPNFSSRASIQDEVNSGEYGIKTSAMPSYSEMLAARRATESDDLPVVFHQQSTKFIQSRHLFRRTATLVNEKSQIPINIRISQFIDDLYEKHFLGLVIGVCMFIILLTLFVILIVM